MLVRSPRIPEHSRAGIFEFIEGFCNQTRIHSSLGYRSPADYGKFRMEGAAVT